METELKACPFCGKEWNTGHYENCYFRVRGKSDEQRELAWKSRPLESALQSALTTAQEENKRYKLALEEISTPQTGLNNPMAIQTLIRFVLIARSALNGGKNG